MTPVLPLLEVLSCDGQPVLVAGDRVIAVGEIVAACHSLAIDAGLTLVAVPGLDRTTLEPVLTYCAEMQCKAMNVACRGCRRAAIVNGYETLDDVINAHAHVRATDTGLVMTGAGKGLLEVPSLAHLAAHWQGEERWFEARRVIRKLRHGIRTREDHRSGQDSRALTPAIILVEPQLADNIGMVARAMANFGLDQLRLVNPRDGWPNERARIAASGATFIIEEAQAYPTLKAAMGDLTWVAATTARQRDLVKPVLTPEQAVAEMIRRTAQGEKCGLIFGRERNGLETAEVADADAIIMAPVDKDFASLNLAQAVLLLSYEWIKASGRGTLGRVTTFETPVESGLNSRASRPATKAELEGFLVQLEDELEKSGFLQTAHKRPALMQHLRTLFVRAAATEQEVRTLRGIVKALVYGKGAGPRLP